jgi:spore coat polysaccharide biosynthesis protein SpsF
MRSTRLPGKVLRALARRPLVEHCVRRLQAAGTGPVILATSVSPADDELVEVAKALGVQVVRGPEDDVLQRFVLVADYLDARFLIRATADNPAVDIEAPGRVVEAITRTGADHVVEAGLPVGAAVEAIRTAALFQAHAQTRDPYDREHVTPYLYRTTGRFLAVRPEAPQELRRPDLRLTVDTPEDYDAMSRLLRVAAPGQDLAPLSAIIRAADRLARGLESEER